MSKKKKIILIALVVILIIIIAPPVIYIKANPYYDEILVGEICQGDVELEGTCREYSRYENINNEYICWIKDGEWIELQHCSFTGCYRFFICSVPK